MRAVTGPVMRIEQLGSCFEQSREVVEMVWIWAQGLSNRILCNDEGGLHLLCHI